MADFIPKLDWKYDSPVTEHELIRIEQGIGDAHDKARESADALTTHMAEKTKQAKYMLTANQSILNNTPTKIAINNKEALNGEDFSRISGDEIEILKDGVYHIIGNVSFAASEAGVMSAYLVSADITEAYVSSKAVGVGGVILNLSAFTSFLSAGTRLYIGVLQTSGTALDVRTGGNTFLKIRKVI